MDITFVSVGGDFWYLIAVIDLYSRYIVGWDLSATMTSRDVQRVIDLALLQYGFYERENKPKIHSDNGSQVKDHTILITTSLPMMARNWLKTGIGSVAQY